MAPANGFMASLREKVYRHKPELGLAFSRDRDEVRGGSEEVIARRIDEEESGWSSSEDKSDTESSNTTQSSQGPKILDEFLDNDDPPEIKLRYGMLPLMQSQDEGTENGYQTDWISLAKINRDMIGQEITFRARVHIVRHMSPKLAFIVFREQTTTVQGVLSAAEGQVSENMVRWAQHIRSGTIAVVKARVKEPEQTVKTTSVHHAELEIVGMHVVSARTNPIPFSVYEAEAATDGHSLSDRVRLANRVLDLRTPTSQAIFRIQSAVCRAFRNYLEDEDFLEVHTPKLQGGATEGGADVFQVNYFGRPAFLAQSPQLAKQMCVSADFGRVYEIGPVFRAGMYLVWSSSHC